MAKLTISRQRRLDIEMALKQGKKKEVQRYYRYRRKGLSDDDAGILATHPAYKARRKLSRMS